LFFDKFTPGTKTKTGQKYFGNTPEISMALESEELEHFDSDAGVKQKDDSVLLELTRSGKFTTDHISPDNMALFFLGTAALVTQTAQVGATYQVVGVKKGCRYQIGSTPSVPAGVRGVSNVVVSVSSVAKTEGVDYEVDTATGGVTILAAGTIADNATIDITYDRTATSYNQVITGANAEIYGALLYISNNPKGDKFDYYWPYVAIRPDGDFALKGDEWQQISFSFEALKLDDATEVCYINGRPGVNV
jgi:hypothetical protein